jgi:hypothetical protein
MALTDDEGAIKALGRKKQDGGGARCAAAERRRQMCGGRGEMKPKPIRRHFSIPPPLEYSAAASAASSAESAESFATVSIFFELRQLTHQEVTMTLDPYSI